MHIHQTIPVTIVDPVTSAPSPAVKHIEDRTLCAYRNMGFALTHFHPALVGVDCHPLVIENMNQLRLYHRIDYTYHLLLRQTYNVKTFQTALGIMADPLEPFTSVDQLVDSRHFAYRHTGADQDIIKSFCRQLESPFAPATQLRLDALAVGPHASAFITSCDILTEEFLLNFVRTAHYTHFLYQHTTNPRYLQAWEAVYGSPKAFSGKPVLLYVGVGPQEFPEDQMKEGTQRSLQSLVARATKRIEAPPAAPSPTLIPTSARQIAQKYGVRLLQRWQMRYFVVRH
ncbi:hypothetical protein TraAM80_04455 [Trypanosoma rangeli]|uniref:Uncharacterized protein n=1 Tax=Trypanosoma rangeli TaxID=5698 RepID=A0A3R7MN63_TRYRA|nr:uncharacterized protein TraAM80_04455 [Trypanosoma rangeli]RNF05533.1 hypothetical protein TraAM80_04455 [Trypanosoma rangeli]|eukprot:RNF05533.1 hypothetical protein TraAM80_04455 [Trypanosoma rangeli]